MPKTFSLRLTFISILFLTLAAFFYFSNAWAISIPDYLSAVSGYKQQYQAAVAQAEAQYKAVVDAAAKAQESALKTLAAQLSAGQITQEQYEAKVAKVQNDYKNVADQAEDTLAANRKIAYQNYQAQRNYAWDTYVMGGSEDPPTPTPSVEPPALPPPVPPATALVCPVNNDPDPVFGSCANCAGPGEAASWIYINPGQELTYIGKIKETNKTTFTWTAYGGSPATEAYCTLILPDGRTFKSGPASTGSTCDFGLVEQYLPKGYYVLKIKQDPKDIGSESAPMFKMGTVSNGLSTLNFFTPGSELIPKCSTATTTPGSIPSALGLEPPLPASNVSAFLTDGVFDGNLGGLAGADQKCQAEAQVKELSGNYKALLAGTNDWYYHYPSSQKVTAAQEQAAGVENLSVNMQHVRYGEMWGNTIEIPAGQTKIFKFDTNKWVECQKAYLSAMINFEQTTGMNQCTAGYDSAAYAQTWNTCCNPDIKSTLTYGEIISACGFQSSWDCGKTPAQQAAELKASCTVGIGDIISSLQADLAKMNAITDPSAYIISHNTGAGQFQYGCNSFKGSSQGCYGYDDKATLKFKVGLETIPTAENIGGFYQEFDEDSAYSGIDPIIGPLRSPIRSFPQEGNYYIAIQNLSSSQSRSLDLLFSCPMGLTKDELSEPFKSSLDLSQNPPALFKPKEYYKNSTFSFNDKNLNFADFLTELAALGKYTWSGMAPSGYLGVSCKNWSNNQALPMTGSFNTTSISPWYQSLVCSSKVQLVCVQQP